MPPQEKSAASWASPAYQTRRRSRRGQTPTDISESIKHALNRSWYDDDKVKVTATGGKVQLSGTVHAWADRQMAAATAWAKPGTTAVENNIAVN